MRVKLTVSIVTASEKSRFMSVDILSASRRKTRVCFTCSQQHSRAIFTVDIFTLTCVSRENAGSRHCYHDIRLEYSQKARTYERVLELPSPLFATLMLGSSLRRAPNLLLVTHQPCVGEDVIVVCLAVRSHAYMHTLLINAVLLPNILASSS